MILVLLTAGVVSPPQLPAQPAAAEENRPEGLDRREAELRRGVEATRRQLSSAELRLAAAKKKFETSTQPAADLLEEVEARITVRDAVQEKLEVLGERIAVEESERAIWKRRQDIQHGGVDPATAESWRTEATNVARDAARAERITNGRIADLHQRQSTLSTRIGEREQSDQVNPWLVMRREALDDLLAVHEAYLGELESRTESANELVDEIQALAGEGALAKGLRDLRDIASAVWYYEITSVDGRPITVATLVTALVLLVVGLSLSRRLSRTIGRTLRQRFNVEAGAASAMETLGFYLLLAAFTLFALRTVNFPLTAFTILGGALAIGIGFGSQNIMNNFISGLILMLERPIRAGDLVQVEGTYGTVEHIGARSTRIRASDNTHIIVPNSFFLQSNVVNWTLSDDIIRAQVNVGVIYGSPTRTVERLIRQALKEHPEILSAYEPRIAFAEFGDNSLNFEAYFWIRARSMMERRKIESDVRYRIDDLFREAGLVIAFPQRDVHLDSAKPIAVRLCSSEGEGSTST